MAVLFSGGLACQSAPCTVAAVSGEYAPAGAVADRATGDAATGGGGATAGGGVFGVYEVSKAEGAPVVVAECEAAAEIEVLDLTSFTSSSALLTSRSSCSLN
ncbi:MAG TPA: hypothetical protein VK794_12290 [Steroidobacteraceae bacterium]|nr:hypothetical protein [Steroidobacteraceae bacterium]